MEIRNEWKIVSIAYLVCYTLLALFIFSLTKKGSILIISLIGIVLILPYIIYNLLKKKQIPKKESEKQENEPDINSLY